MRSDRAADCGAGGEGWSEGNPAHELKLFSCKPLINALTLYIQDIALHIRNQAIPPFTAVGLFVLVGCSTEPAPAGPDTWIISTSGGMSWASGGQLTAELLRKANTFCNTKNFQMMSISTKSKNPDVAQFGNAEFYFRCLTKGDPDIKRTDISQRPDLVIENR